MNQGPNRILDDFAKLMTDAAGAVQGVGKEVETAFKSQAERWLNSFLRPTSLPSRRHRRSRIPM